MSSELQNEIDTFAARCMYDFEYFATTCLKIKPKVGGLEPLVFNKAQQYLNDVVDDMIEQYGKVRVIIVKGRQQGLSTWVEARGYWKVCHEPGMKAYILTHEGEATKNLFNMAKRYHDNAPPDIRPVMAKSNQTEMTFPEMDGEYAIGTAKTGDTGRSQTIQFFHGSEVAYWRAAKEISSGAMEGIPEEPGTEVYLESTAAGFGGFFHSMWQNSIYPGETPHAKWNGYVRVFVPWIWQPEYRQELLDDFERTEDEESLATLHGLDNEQLNWRRRKIAKMENDTARFQRDYPLTPEEAFNSAQDNVLIPADLVVKARAKGEVAYYQPVGSVILGVDVARFGDDSTSFALRQGRVVFWTKRFNKLDSMEVTSEVIKTLRQFKIDFVTVDGTGGYGAGVIDRLREMGYGSKVVEVNFADKPIEDEKYKNKRSEIWASTRDWLLAGAQLPNEDAIQHDLCSVTYKFDSAGDKLQLESKADMKKRGIKSPDIGDAIALTFARPSLGLSGINGRGESFDPDEYFG